MSELRDCSQDGDYNKNNNIYDDFINVYIMNFDCCETCFLDISDPRGLTNLKLWLRDSPDDQQSTDSKKLIDTRTWTRPKKRFSRLSIDAIPEVAASLENSPMKPLTGHLVTSTPHVAQLAQSRLNFDLNERINVIPSILRSSSSSSPSAPPYCGPNFGQSAVTSTGQKSLDAFLNISQQNGVDSFLNMETPEFNESLLMNNKQPPSLTDSLLMIEDSDQLISSTQSLSAGIGAAGEMGVEIGTGTKMDDSQILTTSMMQTSLFGDTTDPNNPFARDLSDGSCIENPDFNRSLNKTVTINQSLSSTLRSGGKKIDATFNADELHAALNSESFVINRTFDKNELNHLSYVICGDNDGIGQDLDLGDKRSGFNSDGDMRNEFRDNFGEGKIRSENSDPDLGENSDQDLKYGSLAQDLKYKNSNLDLQGNSDQSLKYRNSAQNLKYKNSDQDLKYKNSDLDLQGSSDQSLKYRNSAQNIKSKNSDQYLKYGNSIQDLKYKNSDLDLQGNSDQNLRYGNSAQNIKSKNSDRDLKYGNSAQDLKYGKLDQDLNYRNADQDLEYENSDQDIKYKSSDQDLKYKNSDLDLEHENSGQDLKYRKSDQDLTYVNSDRDLEDLKCRKSDQDLKYRKSDQDLKCRKSDQDLKYVNSDRDLEDLRYENSESELKLHPDLTDKNNINSDNENLLFNTTITKMNTTINFSQNLNSPFSDHEQLQLPGSLSEFKEPLNIDNKKKCLNSTFLSDSNKILNETYDHSSDLNYANDHMMKNRYQTYRKTIPSKLLQRKTYGFNNQDTRSLENLSDKLTNKKSSGIGSGGVGASRIGLGARSGIGGGKNLSRLPQSLQKSNPNLNTGTFKLPGDKNKMRSGLYSLRKPGSSESASGDDEGFGGKKYCKLKYATQGSTESIESTQSIASAPDLDDCLSVDSDDKDFKERKIMENTWIADPSDLPSPILKDGETPLSSRANFCEGNDDSGIKTSSPILSPSSLRTVNYSSANNDKPMVKSSLPQKQTIVDRPTKNPDKQEMKSGIRPPTNRATSGIPRPASRIPAPGFARSNFSKKNIT